MKFLHDINMENGVSMLRFPLPTKPTQRVKTSQPTSHHHPHHHHHNTINFEIGHTYPCSIAKRAHSITFFLFFTEFSL